MLGLILGVTGFLQLLCGEGPAGDPRGQQVAWGTLRPAGLHTTAALQKHHLDDLGQGMAIPQGAMPRAGQTAPGAPENSKERVLFYRQEEDLLGWVS